MIALGDFTIHTEDFSSVLAWAFVVSMTTTGLSQVVIGPTLRAGYTLNLVFATDDGRGGLEIRE